MFQENKLKKHIYTIIFLPLLFFIIYNLVILNTNFGSKSRLNFFLYDLYIQINVSVAVVSLLLFSFYFKLKRLKKFFIAKILYKLIVTIIITLYIAFLYVSFDLIDKTFLN